MPRVELDQLDDYVGVTLTVDDRKFSMETNRIGEDEWEVFIHIPENGVTIA